MVFVWGAIVPTADVTPHNKLCSLLRCSHCPYSGCDATQKTVLATGVLNFTSRDSNATQWPERQLNKILWVSLSHTTNFIFWRLWFFHSDRLKCDRFERDILCFTMTFILSWLARSQEYPRSYWRNETQQSVESPRFVCMIKIRN
jgi:hypothetical protein